MPPMANRVRSGLSSNRRTSLLESRVHFMRCSPLMGSQAQTLPPRSPAATRLPSRAGARRITQEGYTC